MKKIARIGQAAYHEAGHAVAAVKLEVPITFVSIEHSRGPFGLQIGGATFCPFDFSRSLKNRTAAEKYLIVLLAGEEAERRWCAQKLNRPAPQVSFDHDRKVAAEMLREIFKTSAERRRFLKQLRHAAKTLIANNWIDVKLLAARLARQKVLRGTVVKRLVKSKTQRTGITHPAPKRIK